MKCKTTMLVQSVIIFVTLLECRSQRRQFDHYQEYLQKQDQQKPALRSDLSDYLKSGKSVYKGPLRNRYYNPTYGLEPYWKGGDWVFERKGKKQVEDPNSDCGGSCFRIYERYGEICAVNKNGTYRNFSSICAMHTADCRGYQDWTISHRGHCRGQYRTFPYFPNQYWKATTAQQVAAASIISAFRSKYPGVGDDKKWVK